MKQGTIEKTLRKFGLFEKETEIYIFLAKRGALKCGVITKQLKMNKGQVYRILRNLQKKGIVEATLEYPTRFTAVPFEKVIDSFIKSKREEVDLIEETKKDLLSDWKKISQTELDSSLEKFGVIEGKKKFFNKISQMIKETNSQFLMSSTVSDLLRAEQFGVYDFVHDHPMKSKIQFRLITQLSKQNLKAIKLLKTKLDPILDFRGRNPSLGLPKFTRIAIRDKEEVILCISDENNQSSKEEKKVCFCTNCKSIVQSFSGVFEELWQDSIDIESLIDEIETGKSHPKTQLIKDPIFAKKTYYEILNSAKKEILIVTSSKGLIGLLEDKLRLKEWFDKGVIIRIMAPITSENLSEVQQLLDYCEVRHIPVGYLETTIVDEHHLFQFRYPPEDQKSTKTPFFDNTFYTNDFDYVKKNKTMLFDIWRKTRVPSAVTLESITRPFAPANDPIQKRTTYKVMKRVSIFGSLTDEHGKITEKDVLNKFYNAKKYSVADYSKDNPPNIVRYFGNSAFAFIHPPDYFGLPDMIIGLWNLNNKSSFGVDNLMHVYLYPETPKSFSFELVAVIQNNPRAIPFRKFVFRGSPVSQNIQLVKKDEFQMRMHGNTLFVGWTVPIPLIPSKYVLPPSCILFEGYGEVKPGALSTIFPSGRKYKVNYNCLEAFVTFFHPSSKYSGPGTEGFIDREFVLTSYSPSNIDT